MQNSSQRKPDVKQGAGHLTIDESVKLRQAEMLLNVSKTMAAFETLDEMLATLVEMTTKEVDAKRGSIFLNDSETGELYSRVAQGNFQREIRILNNRGVAGHVYITGKGTIVHDAYRIREIDRVVVKGKTEPVGVYEVLDYHNEETFPNLMEVVNHFKNGLTQYREGKWDRAIGAFKEALKLNEADKLSQIYIERCEYLKKHPPGDDWNGVWVMTSK